MILILACIGHEPNRQPRTAKMWHKSHNNASNLCSESSSSVLLWPRANLTLPCLIFAGVGHSIYSLIIKTKNSVFNFNLLFFRRFFGGNRNYAQHKKKCLQDTESQKSTQIWTMKMLCELMVPLHMKLGFVNSYAATATSIIHGAWRVSFSRFRGYLSKQAHVRGTSTRTHTK